MGYIQPVSELRNRSKGVVKIGDTLFVDGTPHVECARCGAVIKLTESKQITVGYWPKRAAEYKTDEVTGEWTLVEDAPKPPRLMKAHGCKDCSSTFLQMKANSEAVAKRGGKLFTAFFETKDCDGKLKPTLTPGQFPKPRRK